MSDIGILSGPWSLIMIGLILGSPGLPIGAIVGALAWRRHRIWGAVLGAAAGLATWLVGWLYFSDNL
jgi:Na+/proline symporter